MFTQIPLALTSTWRDGTTISFLWNHVECTLKFVLKLISIQVGWSRFLTCGFSSEAYNAQMNFTLLSIEALALDYSLLSAASLELLTETYMSSLGPFCEKSEDLEYLAHVNTPNVARDIDLVRQLDGYETIDFWGISYGTVLGTAYAGMFPDHLERMVLD